MDKNNSPKKSFEYQYNNKIELPSDNMYIKPQWGLENINIVSISDEIHINKNEDLDTNYLFKTFLENKSKNIFILILIPIIIITELFYRNLLFSLSLKLELNLHKYFSSNLLFFFKIITKAGCEYFIVISLIMTFFYFSLIQTFIYFFGIALCIYIQSLMKMIYGNTRPFLEYQELFKGVCDGGFGNPSGHALVSFYSYLLLLYYIKNHKYFNEKKTLKILLNLLFWIMMFLVIISRFILGLHSINQIVYGSFLGLIIYFIIIHVFKLDKISMITYRKIYHKNKYIIFISLFFILSTFMPLVFASNLNQKNSIDLNDKLNYHCEKVKIYRRFNYDGLFGCIIIFSIMGLYIGQYLFWIILDKYYKINIDKINNDYYLIDELINNWNKYNCILFKEKGNILKLIITIIIIISPIIIFFIIGIDNNTLIRILLFKFAIPLFLISFLLFGIGFYWFVILYFGDKNDLLKNYYQVNIYEI